MKTCLSVSILALALAASAADCTGPGVDMANLYLVTDARTRSISPENFGGEKGKAGMATNGTGSHAARDLGPGWKLSPSVHIKAKTTFILGEIKGPGCIHKSG